MEYGADLPCSSPQTAPAPAPAVYCSVVRICHLFFLGRFLTTACIDLITWPTENQSVKTDGEDEEHASTFVHIFEYDRRFGQAYPDAFVFYDYNEPQKVPDELRGSVDYILMDPPYLVRWDYVRPAPLAKGIPEHCRGFIGMCDEKGRLLKESRSCNWDYLIGIFF